MHGCIVLNLHYVGRVEIYTHKTKTKNLQTIVKNLGFFQPMVSTLMAPFTATRLVASVSLRAAPLHSSRLAYRALSWLQTGGIACFKAFIKPPLSPSQSVQSVAFLVLSPRYAHH